MTSHKNPPPPLNRNESGRSLTEMMGTLAIMGILAIAGIWMYNSAMNRLKANTIINEAQKRAVVVAGQIGFQGRTDPSLGEFSENEFAGGTFSTDVITDGLYQQFGIQVSGVPKAICQNILNTIGDGTAIRRLSNTLSPTIALTFCRDNNSFLLIYNNDMSSSGSDVEYVQSGCGCQTTCGQCIVENNENKCVGECPTTANQCTQNSDCSGECTACVIPDGETQGTCQSCTRVSYLQSNGTQYINTGISMTADDMDIDLFVEFDTFAAEQGYASAFGQDSNFQMAVSSNTHLWGIGNAYSNKVAVLGHLYHLSGTLSRIKDNSKYIVDGEIINLTRATANGGRQLLFTTSTTRYKMSGKIYSFKAQRGDALIADFIPVLDPTGIPAMYDKVSKTLFYNAGTGSFKTDRN